MRERGVVRGGDQKRDDHAFLMSSQVAIFLFLVLFFPHSCPDRKFLFFSFPCDPLKEKKLKKLLRRKSVS